MDFASAININKYNRYLEVILGEGESLMEFNPAIPCYLNDSNTDLISFYKYLNEPDLHSELKLFAQNWELIGKFSRFCSGEILIAFQDLNQGIISSEDVEYMIRAIVMMNMHQDEYIPLFEQKFVVSLDLFTNALINPVVDALLKLKGDKLSDKFESEEEGFKASMETAFKKGFFRHFRSLINWQKTELIDCISLSKHFASWLFIKEFSKEPHLNYDKNGNIKNHYGGVNCNDKVFIKKVNQITNLDFIKKIQNSSLRNNTPTQFLENIEATNKDIIVANLSNSNIILSNGKNYSGLNSQIDQVKNIINMDLNLIVIVEDKKLAIELETISKGKLTTTNENSKLILSNIID
ncbi:MAG: hypothetical protein PF517_09300 [Salinivirgaceae bacterium]|jgi:hypothetical protein|nr:hypothetical protein [Salinivirgaceae bacterium]